MHRLYRRIVVGLGNLYYWWLDYIYVGYWQLKGVLSRTDASQYLNATDESRDPIILIPGVYENWQFMQPIAQLLHDHGYGVHIVEGLGYNTGSIEDMAQMVEAYVKAKDLTSYTIVAHSKGGLIAKYLLMSPISRARQAITINTPFGGSRYAGLFFLKTVRVFLASSPIMQLLSADTQANQRIISIYGLFDPHVPAGSYLDGATNIQVATRGHFRIMSDRLIHEALLKTLTTK
jgi:triacylglycerol lipase